MSRSLPFTVLERVEARRWPAITAGLVAEGRPRLLCARLTGGVVALGRYQRAETTLTERGRALRPVRRSIGGRAIAMGEGVLACALVVPHRSWLVSADGDALPASRFINRAVRGILAGLGRLGIAATYFGRDFVTVGGSQGGHLGFDLAPSGVALLECVLAAEAHWWLPSEVDALPPRPEVRGVPGPQAIAALEGVSARELALAVARGYEEVFSLPVSEDANALPDGAAVPDRPELPLRSSLRSVPSGWIEAGVRIEDGFIAAARFDGELLADSAGIAKLERSVVGARPELASLAPRMNSVYADARHTILGLTDLSVLAQALVDAAGQGR